MPHRQPTPIEADALTAAAVLGFGPCDCHRHSDGRQCACAGHAFLLDDPTRRQGIRVWERLLWMRSQRARLVREEALSPVDAPAAPEPVTVPAGTTPIVLPW